MTSLCPINRLQHRPAFICRRLASALLLGIVLSGPAGAAATVWKCWYNGDTRIQCLLRESADPALAPSPYAHAQLPAALKQMWVTPDAMAEARVFIPLFNEPDDWARVRLLAESVMCGRNQSTCGVEFSRSFAEAVLLDPALED